MTLNGEMALFYAILRNLVVALILHYFTEFVYDVHSVTANLLTLLNLNYKKYIYQ